MTSTPAHHPLPDLATARADLRDLQHRLAVVERQQAFLLRAIDAKVIEIDKLEHPEVGEALGRIVGEAGSERKSMRKGLSTH